MREIFLDVLRCSFHGGIIIALVLVLRLVLKRAPRRTICLLWLLAVLRLLLPFEIESDLSLQPDPEQLFQPQAQVEDFQSQPVPAIPEDAVLPEDVEIVIGDAFVDPEYVFEYEAPKVFDWTGTAAWIWFVGVCGFGVYGAASWLALRRRVREAVRINDGVYCCAGLDTAFVLGSRIYLPAELTGADYVLAHERTHIRRGDQWFKILGFAVLALHWFNPLVWAAYLLLCRDLELACDEAVVRDMDLKERKAYSAALLACAARRSGIAACPVAFGEESVEKRIVSVLNYRRPRFWICLIAVIAVIFVAVCFLTAPGDMTEEKALEAFYREMDELRSSRQLHLHYTMDSLESEFAEVVDLKNQEFWKDGGVWYRTFEYVTPEGSFTTCYAEIDGIQYAREYSGDMPDFQSRDWQQLSGNQDANMPVLTTDWRTLEVLEVTEDEGWTIKLQGDLTDGALIDTYYEKYWEIHLDEDGDLVCMQLFTHGEFYLYYGDVSGLYEVKSRSTLTVEPWDERWKEVLAGLEAYREWEKQQLRREVALLKCETALKDFQSRDSYCVTRESGFAGDVLHDNSTTYYYRSGEDWLNHVRIGGVDQGVDQCTMEKDGVRYRKENSTIHDPAYGASADSGWVETQEVAAQDPWLRSFCWDEADLALTGLSEDGNRVTLTIQGSPHPTDLGTKVKVAEYEATFCFVPGTNTLQSVTLDYVTVWPEFVGGQESTGTGSVSAVISVQDMTAEQIAAVIEAQNPA